MDNKIYSIKWKDGDLLYQPAIGQIIDNKKKRKFKISNKLVSKFPAFNENRDRIRQWQFNPFCLTLHLGNKCNLACTYCYIPGKKKLPAVHFNPEILHEVAEVIALNCKKFKMPFILGFHGGNEPLLHSKLIQECINICKVYAQRCGLELHPYCTTNGVISKKTAIWAAKTFYGITLSWDGQDELHNQFRPTVNGKNTAEDVKRTVSIFTDPQRRLNYLKVRATITNEAVGRILDIVQYFKQFNIKYLDVFPVYQDLSHSISPEIIPDKIAFIKNFLRARKWARKNNIILTYANTRLGEFHDKHCSIFQNNLTITPDGYLTSCFQATHNHHNHHQKYMYGDYDKATKKMKLNGDKLKFLYRQVATPYAQCNDCFNYYHCSKGCPEICPVSFMDTQIKPFDCRIEKWISLANVIESAGYEIEDADIESCEDFLSSIEVCVEELENLVSITGK